MESGATNLRGASERIASLIDSGADLSGGGSRRKASDPSAGSDGTQAPADDNRDQTEAQAPQEESTQARPEKRTEAHEAPEAADGDSGSDAQPVEPEAYYETLAELAESLEADVSDLMPLRLQVKSRGRHHEVALQDLVSDYQKFDDYQAKTTRLAEQRRQHEAEREAWVQAYKQNFQQAEDRFHLAEAMLREQWESPELRQLEIEDPGTAALRRQQLQERAGRLQWERQQGQEQYRQNMERVIQEHNAAQHRQLLEIAPDWGESAKRQVEDYVLNNGFTTQEIQAIGASARLTHAMLQLVRLQEASKTAVKRDEQVKKVLKKLKKTVPRAIPAGNGVSGKPQPAPTAKARRVKELRRHAKETGRVRDAASAINALLSGG